MALAAEVINFPSQPDFPRLVPPQEAQAQFIADLEMDKFTRAKAEHFAGEITAGRLVQLTEVGSEEQPKQRIESLREAMELASKGDKEAIALLDINSLTNVMERAIKAGMILDVDCHVDPESGEVSQHGQSDKRIQANTMLFGSKHPVMRARARAENRNIFRKEDLLRAGKLKDNVLLEVSLVPTEMTREEAREQQFFTDSMSLVLRLTTEDEEQQIKVESAFAAGVVEPGGKRHDLEAMVRVGNKLGLDFEGKTVTELLDAASLVPKAKTPNGIVDFVRLFDEAVVEIARDSGEADVEIFFGQAVKDKPDYLVFREQCRERQDSFRLQAESIRKELLSRIDEADDELAASLLLDEITERHVVELAFEDHSIDVRVLGSTAAAHVEEGRIHRANGNDEMAQRSMYRAIETAQTTGCAGGPALLQKARGAYGNYWMHKKKEDEEDKDSWHGGTILLLKKCNSCKEVQAKVGVCRICEACVRNPLRFKKEATKKRKGGYAFTVNKGNVTQLFPEKAKKERAAA